MSPEDVSKYDRHVLRLVAVLHVLYDQLIKFCKETQNPYYPKSLVVPPFTEVSYSETILLHSDVFLTRSAGVNTFFSIIK